MINATLNPAALADQFRTKGRLQIRDFLHPEVAERLHECLQREVPWGLAYRDGNTSTVVPAEKLAAFSNEDWVQITNKIYALATKDFQFAYNSYMMITAYRERRDQHLPLHQVVEFLNSPVFLEFVKNVTGANDVTKTDAQATRYIPGHFLMKHNDFNGPKNRRIAYVINLTKAWRAEWGGLLEFLDNDGQVTEVYLPLFNSLTLFSVPAWHQVSYVAPFAQGGRYAITGWAMAA